MNTIPKNAFAAISIPAGSSPLDIALVPQDTRIDPESSILFNVPAPGYRSGVKTVCFGPGGGMSSSSGNPLIVSDNELASRSPLGEFHGLYLFNAAPKPHPVFIADKGPADASYINRFTVLLFKIGVFLADCALKDGGICIPSLLIKTPANHLRNAKDLLIDFERLASSGCGVFAERPLSEATRVFLGLPQKRALAGTDCLFGLGPLLAAMIECQ